MISPEKLQSAISNVSVWRQGDVCAPHKPLLLLYVLSQYKAGHPRLFNYGLEIHEPLTRLLKEFGPKRRTDYPNMPFWRLRTDGFWEIAHAEGCKPRKGNTQPTKKELIDNQVAGGFDEAAYQQLLAHPEMIDQLAQKILTDRFPESIQRILANQLGFDLSIAPGTATRVSGISFFALTTHGARSAVTISGWMVRWLVLKRRIFTGKHMVVRAW
ncbi:restriction endonuclease [Klebsiella pneumoniae]|uniref:Restriction endonuclease n=1 Tax=Klebsiella pneumoniae TaxID=573 RepID=A0A2X3EWX3_KLEPN|nr:restriction endonuclease [Klebsiella pneumoniae]